MIIWIWVRQGSFVGKNPSAHMMYEYFRNTSSTAGLAGQEIDCQVVLSGNCDSCHSSRQVAQGSKVCLVRDEARMRLRYGRSH